MAPISASPIKPMEKPSPNPCPAGRPAQGGARGRGVPQVPGAESRVRGNQHRDLPFATGGGGDAERAGKKTAEAIRQEIAREVDQLLRVVFQERRKTGRIDLEATEMAVRAALHRAGAAALSQLLRFPAPADDQRNVPCSCGQAAHYHQLRTKPVLTAVGWAEVSRPYYWCPTCHAGQFPADRELDIENTELLSRGTAHASPAGPGGALRSGPGTTASSGGLGGDREIRGAYGGGPRRRDGCSASKRRSSKPCRCPSPPWPGSRFRSCMCKWMGRECRW